MWVPFIAPKALVKKGKNLNKLALGSDIHTQCRKERSKAFVTFI